LKVSDPDPIPRWLQTSPARAARAIVTALVHRRAECVLAPLAKVVIVAERLMPAAVAEAIKLGHIRGHQPPSGQTPAGRLHGRVDLTTP
jgi:hypothetical protein